MRHAAITIILLTQVTDFIAALTLLGVGSLVRYFAHAATFAACLTPKMANHRQAIAVFDISALGLFI